MRWMAVLACTTLLAACVSHRPGRPRTGRNGRPPQRPSRRNRRHTPVKLDTPTPRPQGPGSNVPLEGFRPLRSPASPGA